jgi:hypothetical protein
LFIQNAYIIPVYRATNCAKPPLKNFYALFVKTVRRSDASIGRKNETSLHNAIKERYAAYGGAVERETAGFVCDAVRADGTVVEVQTGSFAPLRAKARAICPSRGMIIAAPVITKKTIETYSANGALLRRSVSPKHESDYELFGRLVYAWTLPFVRGLSVEIVRVEVTEKRVADGRGSWRRGGVSIVDREVSAWGAVTPLKNVSDYAAFVPFTRGCEWTAAEFAKAARITKTLAGKAVYVLARLGIIEKCGQRGRAYLYTFSNIA